MILKMTGKQTSLCMLASDHLTLLWYTLVHAIPLAIMHYILLAHPEQSSSLATAQSDDLTVLLQLGDQLVTLLDNISVPVALD